MVVPPLGRLKKTKDKSARLSNMEGESLKEIREYEANLKKKIA